MDKAKKKSIHIKRVCNPILHAERKKICENKNIDMHFIMLWMNKIAKLLINRTQKH